MALSTSLASGLASGSAPSLRQRNSRAVLEALYRHSQGLPSRRPTLRVVEIMEMTGLSRPTVETVTEGLLEQGWLSLGDPADGGGRLGRPARTYSFHARAGYVVGVDVGAHAVAVSVADLLGEQVALTRTQVSPTTSAGDRFATLEKALTTSLATAGLRPHEPLALTAGTPGILDPARQRVLTSPGLAGWEDFDLLSALKSLVDCDVELENDANLAAIAERGTGHDAPDHLLFLLLGERLGAGVIANGQLVRGHNGASGELWYVRSSAGTSAADAEQAPAHQGRSLGAVVNAPALSSTRTVQGIAHELALGISPALLTLNPEILVLGGDMAEAGPLLREALTTELQETLLYPPRVQLSRLGLDTILAGAIAQARSRVERDVLARVVA